MRNSEKRVIKAAQRAAQRKTPLEKLMIVVVILFGLSVIALWMIPFLMILF